MFLSDDDILTQALERSRSPLWSYHDDTTIEMWVASMRQASSLSVELRPLTTLTGWSVEAQSGNVVHESGRFFSLTGVHVRQRCHDQEIEWDQPIIDQPEVGILGIIVKVIGGVLHFCLQAKEEPGNLHGVQLSPTVQATYSNYTRSHGGSRPRFIDYFLDPHPEDLLFAKLQTEDGGRFLYKSNRNMIVRVGDDELCDLPADFVWLTLHQIATLMARDNLIHATTRSVLCGLLLSSGAFSPETGKGLFPRLYASLQWIDDQAAVNHFLVKRTNLSSLQEWEMSNEGHYLHRQRRFFRIVGLRVEVKGREVGGWDQPILHNPESGVIGLLTQVRDGERFFLMQAKAEPGNRTTVQLGPTVQFTPGNYIENEKLRRPFLFDEFLGPRRFIPLVDSMQSEEGARFYHESHRHRILELHEGDELDIPEDFRWISEVELLFFLMLGQQVNSCARSILACLSSPYFPGVTSCTPL